ncbi:transmembrane protein 252 [Spea bombifrons]|uniref:transmembrane protein 252 n=1 Tax=Spea bombifrons TaxID=233779 RepID=UPI00234BA76A|nr:transmembrane protein 252 [Spea bombifrons]
MKIKASMYTVIRFSLLIIGFTLVCLGAFYISSSYVCNCKREIIVAYSLLPVGFILLLVGIFWSTYHEANHKNLFHNMIRRIHSQQEAQVETVDRPNFYPPSYDSVIQEIQMQPGNAEPISVVEVGLNIPPPLYTESSVDIVDETYNNQELPPSYEVSVQPSNTDTGCITEDDSGVVHVNNVEMSD